MLRAEQRTPRDAELWVPQAPRQGAPELSPACKRWVGFVSKSRKAPERGDRAEFHLARPMSCRTPPPASTTTWSLEQKAARNRSVPTCATTSPAIWAGSLSRKTGYPSKSEWLPTMSIYSSDFRPRSHWLTCLALSRRTPRNGSTTRGSRAERLRGRTDTPRSPLVNRNSAEWQPTCAIRQSIIGKG